MASSKGHWEFRRRQTGMSTREPPGSLSRAALGDVAALSHLSFPDVLHVIKIRHCNEVARVAGKRLAERPPPHPRLHLGVVAQISQVALEVGVRVGVAVGNVDHVAVVGELDREGQGVVVPACQQRRGKMSELGRHLHLRLSPHREFFLLMLFS